MGSVSLTDLGLSSDDLSAIGKLSEKGMTPEQIANAVEKAGQINSSASEIDGVIQRSKNTLILLGDSITAGNTSNSPNIVTITTNVGQAVWGNAIAGNPFDIIYCAGVGGQNSTQILARVDDDVISKKPSHCMFLCGMNDGVTTENTETLKNNIASIYYKLNTAGIYCYVCTNTTANANAAKNAQAMNVNNWMQVFFANLPNVEVVDLCSAWISPTSADGSPKTNVLRDSVHPSSLGGFLGGVEISKHFSKVKPKYLLETSNYNSRAVNSISKNMASNPLLVGTSGVLQGNTTGDVASSHRIYTSAGATCVASKEARPDGFGENQIMTITSTAPNAYSRLEIATSGVFEAGSTIYAMAEIEIVSAVGLNRIQASMNIDNVTKASLFANADAGTNKPIDISEAVKMVYVTPKITLSNTSTLTGLSSGFNLQVYFSSAGTAVVKIGRVSYIKI